MPVQVIFSTTPDLASARKLASLLVEQRLAACVSFQTGFNSYFRWKGKVDKQKEVLLLIKTSSGNYSKIKKVFEKHHPYEVPEILALPVCQGSPAYLSWLRHSLK